MCCHFYHIYAFSDDTLSPTLIVQWTFMTLSKCGSSFSDYDEFDKEKRAVERNLYLKL